jgi:hypothetical protein
MKALFIFRTSGVQRLFYAPITQEMVDSAPFFFRSVTKPPYPWIMRSYFTKNVCYDAVVTKEEVNEFEKTIETVQAYHFNTPTPILVAHLSLLSPSANKDFSAAWFDEQKNKFNSTSTFNRTYP